MNENIELLMNDSPEPLDEMLAAIGLPPQAVHALVEPQEADPSCPMRWLGSPD